MTQSDDVSKRPERVIILDAEDPMTEIHGRFVWQDEHDRVVKEVRERAFADGFALGLQRRALDVRGRRRVPRLSTLARVGILLLLALLVLLMLPVVLS